MTGWLVDLLILLGVIAIVAIAGWFIVTQISLPEPLRKILLIVLVVIAAIVAIAILLQLRGGIGKLSGEMHPLVALSPVMIRQAATNTTRAREILQ